MYVKSAPEELIAKYEKHLAERKSGKSGTLEIPDLVAETLASIPREIKTPELLKKIERRVRKTQILLPANEHWELLRRLITEERMGPVWKNLRKRRPEKGWAHQLYLTCDLGIAAWRRTTPETPAQRRAALREIAKLASRLRDSLEERLDFDHFSNITEMSGDDLAQMLDMLESPLPSEKEDWESYVRFYLPEYIYPISYMLGRLEQAAMLLSVQEQKTKKAHSKNAEAHHLMRGLCQWMDEQFGSPLYESVAIITSVALQTRDFDKELVTAVFSKGSLNDSLGRKWIPPDGKLSTRKTR